MKYRVCCVLFSALLSAVGARAQSVEPAADTARLADEKVNVLFGRQDYGRFVGNASAVKGDELRSYPAMMINEALAGRLPGVFIRQNSGLPGSDNFNVNIRGNLGGYIVLVDGVDRALTQYDIEQIEEVRVLKDPVSKALYGGRMSNGIIMVTTRRGKNMPNQFRMGVQQGLKTPTSLPGYLGAYDFATRYNEALANDGITTGRYGREALDAYRDGSRPYQYPDVDYYGEFLRKTMNLTRVNADYFGGTERTRFYVHGAYQTEGGLERYGDRKTRMEAFNLQANLDTRFSDFILLDANFAGYLGNKASPGGFSMGTLSSRYPNAYPIFVDDGKPGGTDTWKDNPFAGQALSGYNIENHLRVQADIGVVFKLDKLVRGLSIRPAYTLDVYHKQNLSKVHRPAIYRISSFDAEGNPTGYEEVQTEQLATSQWLSGEDYLNRWAFTGTVAYDRTFGNHAVTADLLYYISKYGRAGNLYDYKRQNLGLRVNYSFAGRYTFEGVVNYVGSQSYEPRNRFKVFPAAGIGWLISGEEFMKNARAVDFLKINASWGVMGDGNVATNLWRQTWMQGGNYYFNTADVAQTTYLSQVYNEGIDWPKQREIDISIEGNFLRSIHAKVSYFDYEQSGLLSKNVNGIPSMIGGSSYLPYVNLEKNAMAGVEAELSYTRRFNEVDFHIGGHVTYSRTKKKIVDELADPNFSTVGSPTDAVWGYRFDGYYSQDEIDAIRNGNGNLPEPSFMDPYALKVGNLKYKDLNGDGVIDKYDTQVIGNSAPNLMFGFDVSVKYKGFGLYAMFLGYGAHNRLLNNSYYQVYSTRKYSNVLLDGLPNGNPHPLLTTGSGTNDFQTSDYWIANGAYLKLQNVALSYSLPEKAARAIAMKDLTVTLYGTDLFTVSKIKDLEPEALEAGVTVFPLFRTFALGLSMTF